MIKFNYQAKLSSEAKKKKTGQQKGFEGETICKRVSSTKPLASLEAIG